MVIEMKIFGKALRERSRGILVLTVFFMGMALYTVVTLSSMSEDMVSSFDEMLDNPAFKAFGKSVITLTTIEGLLIVELYQWGIELLLAGYVILFTASFISSEIEKKTIDLLLANPVSRTRILLEKYGAMIVMVVMIDVALFIEVIAGLAYIGEETDIEWLVYTHMLFMPFLLAVGSYSTFLSTLFDDTRRAMSVGLGILLGSFLLDSISLTRERYASISKVTLFHYFDPGMNLILHEVEWNHVIILCVVAIAFLAAAVVWFNKKDINVA
jgi:ABC-2 type transport system permease protein